MTSTGFSAADDDIKDTPTNNHGTLNSQSTTTGEYQAANLEFETVTEAGKADVVRF